MDTENDKLDLNTIILPLYMAEDSEQIDATMRMYLDKKWIMERNKSVALHTLLVNLVCKSAESLPLLGKCFTKFYKDTHEHDVWLFRDIHDCLMAMDLISKQMPSIDVHSGSGANLLKFTTVLLKTECAHADHEPMVSPIVDMLVRKLRLDEAELDLTNDQIDQLITICRTLINGPFSHLLKANEHAVLREIATRYFTFIGHSIDITGHVS